MNQYKLIQLKLYKPAELRVVLVYTLLSSLKIIFLFDICFQIIQWRRDYFLQQCFDECYELKNCTHKSNFQIKISV